MFTRKDDKSDFTQDVCICILLLALVTITIFCFSSGISGNDFWWHVKVGQWIVEHREVPTTDIFSWYGTEKGISWTAHEWLADVIFYGIHSQFGEIGIFLFCIVAALVMQLLMFQYAIKYIRKNLLVGGLFLTLFAVISSLFFYGRPQIFSYFLLFFELKILYEFQENQNSKKIYFIPLFAVLWSNLHGGSASLAYSLCIVFLLSGLVNISYERLEAKRFDRKATVKLILVTAGAILGILVNPIGFRVLTYPYINLSDHISMTMISEWQPPDAKRLGDLILYFFPMVVMSIGIVCGKKKIRIIDLLIMLAFMFLFFRSSRFIILWYMAAGFYAFRYVTELKVKKVTKLSEKIAVLLLMAILVVPCAMGVFDTVKTYQEGKLISKTMTDEAVQAVKADAPQRVYNDYNLGEALIYHDIPVFFDARADLYAQEKIMDHGVSLMYLQPVGEQSQYDYVDVDEMIEKYDFDAMLILKSRPLYSYIMNCPERFELVYEDDGLGYFRIIGGNINP